MKIVTHYFESVAGIGIFPAISFLIFFVFFIVVTIMVFRMKKSHVNELSNIPLELDDDMETNSSIS